MTIETHYSSYSLGPYTSYTSRINGYVASSVSSSVSSSMPSGGLGAWINSGNPNYRNVNVEAFYQITSPGLDLVPAVQFIYILIQQYLTLDGQILNYIILIITLVIHILFLEQLPLTTTAVVRVLEMEELLMYGTTTPLL